MHNYQLRLHLPTECSVDSFLGMVGDCLTKEEAKKVGVVTGNTYSKTISPDAVQYCIARKMRRDFFRRNTMSIEDTRKNAFGKEDTMAGRHYNWSHDGCVAFFEGDTSVGVDIVDMNRLGINGTSTRVSLSTLLWTMEAFLTQNEVKRLSSMSAHDDKVREFSRMWCIKESIMKCIGCGLDDSISTIDTTSLCMSTVTVDTPMKAMCMGVVSSSFTHKGQTVSVVVMEVGSQYMCGLSVFGTLTEVLVGFE